MRIAGAAFLVALLADFLISLSIRDKNATLAGLIEISYPLFIAIFSILLLRQNHLRTGVVGGGALIFAGVLLVRFSGR